MCITESLHLRRLNFYIMPQSLGLGNKNILRIEVLYAGENTIENVVPIDITLDE